MFYQIKAWEETYVQYQVKCNGGGHHGPCHMKAIVPVQGARVARCPLHEWQARHRSAGWNVAAPPSSVPSPPHHAAWLTRNGVGGPCQCGAARSGRRRGNTVIEGSHVEDNGRRGRRHKVVMQEVKEKEGHSAWAET